MNYKASQLMTCGSQVLSILTLSQVREGENVKKSAPYLAVIKLKTFGTAGA